jgi:uncharacterized RDD family membrane protein YckC
MNGSFFCNKCGASNDASAQFCSRCGAAFSPVASSATSAGGAAAPAPAMGYSTPSGYPVAQAGARYGGFWIRVVAAIIDAILVRLILAPIGAILGLGGLAMGGMIHPGIHLFHGPFVLLILCGSWLYEALMESSSYQATLGKMIFGMKVTDLYGNRISFARASGRHFAKILSGMILGIGFIMVGFTERKQGLHDMIAGTLVRRF